MQAHIAYDIWDTTDRYVRYTGRFPPWLTTMGAVAYGSAPHPPTQPIAILTQASEPPETPFEQFCTWAVMLKRLVLPFGLNKALIERALTALRRLTERHEQLRDQLWAVVMEAFPDTVTAHEESGMPPCAASYTLVSLMSYPNRQAEFFACLWIRYQALQP